MKNEIAPQKRDVLVVEDESPISYLMDTARFEHLQRVSRLMAMANLTPKHLQGANIDQTLANCFRVVSQAMRWGMDPFAVVDETFVVSGKLGYQGKLVAAVINARANLAQRLSCEFSGQGEARTIRIVGQFRVENSPRDITLSIAQAKTANKMWVTDPDQKLWYSGVVKWARRHCPEILLGVLTDDDLERMKESGTCSAVADVAAKLHPQPDATITASAKLNPQPTPEREPGVEPE